MIALREINGLPFAKATVIFKEKALQLDRVLIDTVSAGTFLNVNRLEEIGVRPVANDTVHTIHGVGGIGFVYSKPIDQLLLTKNIGLRNFSVELGSMKYGLESDGIIGYGFMK